MLKTKKYNRRPKPRIHKERAAKAMTICIGALCNEGTVALCLSDTEVTSDIKTHMKKYLQIVGIDAEVFVMIAGDVSEHLMATQRTQQEVNEISEKSPDKKWTVEHIARIYHKNLKELTRHYEDDEFKDEEAPYCQAIIIGFDGEDKSGHIYQVDNYKSKIVCKDDSGCAYIGTGASIARAMIELMGGYNSDNFHDAMFIIYMAKKFSEIADGVGRYSRWLIKGPGVKEYMLRQRIADNLRKYCDELHEAIIQERFDVGYKFRQYFYKGINEAPPLSENDFFAKFRRLENTNE